jgi:hypothetical protein
VPCAGMIIEEGFQKTCHLQGLIVDKLQQTCCMDIHPDNYTQEMQSQLKKNKKKWNCNFNYRWF